MTEKRFTLVKCYNEQWGVVDKSLEKTDQLVLITTSKSGTGYIVNVLNALHEENEQLKQQLVDVTKSIDSLCNRVDKVNRSNEFKWGAIMGLRTLQRELKGDLNDI